MAKKFLVFQHTPWEGPGQFFLAEAGKHQVKLKIVKVWKDEIPALTPYDALIVLGGGPNVNEEEEFPFLVDEKKAIRQSIGDDRPYLGFCLGHQLLADALGAAVGPNFKRSVGFVEGFLTREGRSHPLFAGLPPRFPFFKWHGQAVREPLPGHVNVLATSADCQVEAISVKNRPHIIGTQFDNHATASEDVKRWLASDAEWLMSKPDLDLNPEELIAAAAESESRMADEFSLFFENFLSFV